MFLLALCALAQEEGTPPWIGALGVEGYAWGTNDVPFDAVPRPKDFVLPDSAFIGASKKDKPDDMELKAPPGERRFLRYAHGVLVDAWLVSEKPVDAGMLVGYKDPDWTGVVLGPGEDGMLAYGLAKSWTLGDRTVLHWKDREGKREVVASRAAPTPQYGIGRPEPLKLPGDTGAAARLSGDLRKAAKDYGGHLAGCFDTSPKPVAAKVLMKFDGRGQPTRIRVSADQPAFDLEDCVAAALMQVVGPPNALASLEMLRFR
ncbi:MAG: hypothetical protein ACOZNI_04590 [Myxococcota bacterium]